MTLSKPKENKKASSFIPQHAIYDIYIFLKYKTSPFLPYYKTDKGFYYLPGSQNAFRPQGLGLHRSADVKGRQETNGSPVDIVFKF